jgi:Holliday junction resolvase RusA-like endonuclease
MARFNRVPDPPVQEKDETPEAGFNQGIMMITFTVPGIPIPQPRQRHSIIGHGLAAHVTNYTPKKHKVRSYKAEVQFAFRQAYQGEPIQGPVGIRIVFLFPRTTKIIWKTKPMVRLYHEVKPDADNCAKAVKDALKALAWRDDSQVADLQARKLIVAGDEQPHTEIEIWPLEELVTAQTEQSA